MGRIKNVLVLLGILALCAVAFKIGRISQPQGPPTPPEVRVDTLYIRDTVVSYKPVYVAKTKLDTVLVPVGDTLTLRDTLWLALEREKVEWRDTLSTVWASGVEVSVDSVRHYVTEKVIVKEVPYMVKDKSRWGVGVQAGVGAGRDGLVPYVGVGVSYNLLSF